MKAPIATLDMSDFYSHLGGTRLMFVNRLRQELSTTGFFFLKNHNISREAVDALFDLLPIFFKELSEEDRMRYHFPGASGQIGYTPLNVETGEFAKVADAKHFFHVYNGVFPNVEKVPGLSNAAIALFYKFSILYIDLLFAIEQSLGLDPGDFAGAQGDSVLRAIHYPAHENPETSNERVEELIEGGNVLGMCASRHTDINMLTLLFADSPGLELLWEGEWRPVTTADTSTLIVNCGDMLEHVTGGRYKSGQHRVVCEPGKERFSTPFFGHLKGETSIVPLKHLGESDLERFHFKTAGEFLAHRLEQIKLAT